MQLTKGTICRVRSNYDKPIKWLGEEDKSSLKRLFPTWDELNNTLVEIIGNKVAYSSFRVQPWPVHSHQEKCRFDCHIKFLHPVSPLELLALEAENDRGHLL